MANTWLGKLVLRRNWCRTLPASIEIQMKALTIKPSLILYFLGYIVPLKKRSSIINWEKLSFNGLARFRTYYTPRYNEIHIITYYNILMLLDHNNSRVSVYFSTHQIQIQSRTDTFSLVLWSAIGPLSIHAIKFK